VATLTTPKYAIPYPDANEPVAGGAAAMQAIAQAIEAKVGLVPIADSGVLAVAASNIDFTSIPQTFSHILVVYLARLTGAEAAGWLMLNGDSSAANYANGGALGGLIIPSNVPGTTYPNFIASGQVFVPFYRATTRKGIFNPQIYNNGNNIGGGVQALQWYGTAAINRMTFTPAAGTWAIGSRFILYGVT
jgi:hypothetical protein